MSRKSHEVIAIEKGVINRTQAIIDNAYQALSKEEFFKGHTRTYTPRDENGSKLDDESRVVQRYAQDTLKQIADNLSEQFDVTSEKEKTNTYAKADVVLSQDTTLKDVPVTTLLFLEKKLIDLRTAINATPILPATEEWTPDPTKAGQFRSRTRTSFKTEKIVVPLVLHPATDKHPAQTQTVSKDVTIGEWSTTNLSGALTPDRKIQLLNRVNVAIDAVKQARERANDIQSTAQPLGKVFMDFIFGK